QYFGVGLRAEDMTALAQRPSQHAGVFDDAVVYEGERAAAVGVGVGVDGVGRAVRRPARVRDRGRAFGQIGAELPFEHGDLTRRAEDFQSSVHDGESRRVVAAILESLQALEDDRGRRSLPRIPYDSAHNRRPSAISFSASAPDGASAINRMIGSVPDGRTCSQRSGHARRSPSCVSISAPVNFFRNPSYTASSRAPRSTLAFTIV